MKIIKRKVSIAKIIIFFVLICYTVFLFSMMGWAFFSSFKHKLDFILYPTSLFPSKELGGWHFKNYITAYLTMNVKLDLAGGATKYVYAEGLLLNSAIWIFGSVLLNTFTTALVSYCCARFSRKLFSKIIYFTTVFAISMPIIGSLPSQMRIIRFLHLYNSLMLIPATKISFISIYFLVFYAIFSKIPSSYREAAEIDGAGDWMVFFRIALPMVTNTLVAIFILNFITYWNDYTFPMMFLPSYPTLAQGVYDLINGQGSRNANLSDATALATSLMVALPPIIVFIIFRNKIMNNVTMGGIKG